MQVALSPIDSRKRKVRELELNDSHHILLHTPDGQNIYELIDKFLQDCESEIIPIRKDFIRCITIKAFNEICERKGDIHELIQLLYKASNNMEESLTSSSSWEIRSEFNDPIELVRPKSSEINWNHARIQPLNWACRCGHVELLRFFINHSPHVEIDSEVLGDNKLYSGAITFAAQSGNTEMIDYLCRDVGFDPNRGPKDWEPSLVLFWDTDNWDILLSLIRGGASLHHESKRSTSVMRHMFIDGYGWDCNTRLDALLTLLLLGTPFYEDNKFVWPAPIISRDYHAFRKSIKDVRDPLCWNSNYEYVLNFIPKAKKMSKYQRHSHLQSLSDSNDNHHFSGSGSRSSSISHEDDNDNDLSEDSVDIYEPDTVFLTNLKRKWMNTVAILLQHKNMRDDHISYIFNILLPLHISS
jgi:hypothetical protein